MAKQKLVYFIPNSRWFGRRPWIIWPQSALILTSLLKEDFDFKILDANIYNFSEDKCKLLLREMQPAAVLVSGFSVEYQRQYHTALALAKATCPDAITVLGGVYPTVLGEEAIKDSNIDYIFLGHAEERICEFLSLALGGDKKVKNLPGIGFRDESGNIVINPVRSHISEVKKLAKLDYSLIDVDAYLEFKGKDYQFNTVYRTSSLVTSYGCPYNCLFCAARTISGRGIAYRSVENVLEEIELLKYKYRVENLAFIDDYFLGDRQRIYSILNAFIERKYNLPWKSANVCA